MSLTVKTPVLPEPEVGLLMVQTVHRKLDGAGRITLCYRDCESLYAGGYGLKNRYDSIATLASTGTLHVSIDTFALTGCFRATRFVPQSEWPAGLVLWGVASDPHLLFFAAVAKQAGKLAELTARIYQCSKLQDKERDRLLAAIAHVSG